MKKQVYITRLTRLTRLKLRDYFWVEVDNNKYGRFEIPRHIPLSQRKKYIRAVKDKHTKKIIEEWI